MILTLKIKLVSGLYADEGWEGTLEIGERATLLDLHEAIQHAVRFDNDHMFAFYVARTPHSRPRLTYDDDNGLIGKTKIGRLYPLPAKRSLFYLFDYGDHWVFKVSKSRLPPSPPMPRVEYPRLVHSEGKRPVQYPVLDE